MLNSEGRKTGHLTSDAMDSALQGHGGGMDIRPNKTHADGQIDRVGSLRLNCPHDSTEGEPDHSVRDLRFVDRGAPISYRCFRQNCREGPGRQIAYFFFANKCERKGTGFHFCTSGLSHL